MPQPWEEDQLALFGGAYTPKQTDRVGPAALDPRIGELGTKLPEQLRMGTSSWSFPGWKDIVWDREASESTLARTGLPAYAEHPLMGTVGIDRSYYAPVPAAAFRDYAKGVPSDFRFLVKAHEYCTVARFPMHARYRNRSGQLNPHFLNADYATEHVVRPTVEGLGEKLGVLLFQFPPQDVALMAGTRSFAVRLRSFFEALPRGPLYAVEVRNSDLITRAYADALNEVGATHCLNVMPGMPELAIQYNASGADRRPALVIRWMLNRGFDYARAKERYSPFSRLVDEDATTREDVARLLARAPGPSYLIVNNKAEGSSPLSILKVAERIATLVDD